MEDEVPTLREMVLDRLDELMAEGIISLRENEEGRRSRRKGLRTIVWYLDLMLIQSVG